jgi:hypothetical protein
MTEYAGPSSRLLAGYAAVYRHTTTRGRVPGLVDHVVGTNRDGITIIEQWESAAAYRSYAESPHARAAAAESGLPVPTVQVLDVFGPSRQLARLAS